MADLAKLTYREAAALYGPRTIALLPVGATEPHGPHLPLDTDVTIAVAQVRRAAELLAEAGVQALQLPPIAFGITNYTTGFAGRITLRPGTLWALVEDILNSVEQDGIRHLVLANAHLEPEHVRLLRNVIVDRSERDAGKIHVVFADVTRKSLAQALGDEFKSGDCHAGSYETSLVMAADPARVREVERKKLAPKRIDLLLKMKAGISTFRDAGAVDAYCGDPSRASAEEGRQRIETLAGQIVTLARESWPDLFEDARA